MDDGSRMLLGLIICIAFILIKGFITACEAAVIEVNDARLKKQAERDKASLKLINLLQHPNKLIISLAIFKALTAVTVAIVATISFYFSLSEKLDFISSSHKVVALLSIFIIVLITTVLLAIFGDSIPKSIVQKNSMAFALKISGVLKILMIIMAPLTKLISFLTYIFGRIIGVSIQTDNQAVTEEEILMMVDAVNESGDIEESQKEMINNIFEFDDLLISDVMTHRTDIIAVEKDTEIKELVNSVINEGISRIPIYENSIDNVIGIVYIKDLLVLINSKDVENTFISDFIRDVMYVPQTNHCGELFKEFTSTKSQIAIVVDEYGGTAGLVTMEDLLESIVGNIQDEYDNEIEDIVQIDENTFEISGTADPEDIFVELGLDAPVEDYYDTMGGFVIDILGHIPNENEFPTVEYNDVKFTVLSTEEKRIVKMKAEISANK